MFANNTHNPIRGSISRAQRYDNKCIMPYILNENMV